MANRFISLHLVTILIMGWMLMSCNQDDAQHNSMSTGALSIVIDADPVVSIYNGATFDTGANPAEESISLSMTSASGEYGHTWESFMQFPQGKFYFVGTYSLEATAGDPMVEGFDLFAFDGKTQVVIGDGTQTEAPIVMRIANALVRVDCSGSVQSSFKSFGLMAHTPGGRFHEIAPDDSRILCLSPGSLELYADVETLDGHSLRFPMLSLPSISASTLYIIDIDCEETPQGSYLTGTCGNYSKSILMSESFINASAPEIEVSWQPAKRLELPEGEIPAEIFSAKVTTGASLGSLILSTRSQSLQDRGFPAEVDLLSPSAEQAVKLREFGLAYELSPTGGMIDFTTMLGQLVFLSQSTSLSTFTLLAASSDGKVSAPVTLEVSSTPVDIRIEKVYPVTMAVNRARIDVKCESQSFADHVEIEVLDSATRVWNVVTPVEITRIDDDVYSVAFDVPSGSNTIEARVLYCEEVRASLHLPRVQPAFTIQVDPYATMAAIRVIPSDPDMIEQITRETRVYIDGSEVPSYLTYPSLGILTVIGLKPASTYTFKATMMSGVDNPAFTPSVTATTEDALQFPNADFEERNDGPSYKDLPSGGRYAQTVVEIFNWQHSTSISTEVPKQWATTNAKTFAMGSTNHNTWYMQPSAFLTRDPVFSQSFAVELVSVGFDPHGQSIPPYAQTGQPYLDYSPIVPDIAYRAAGKLFLGSYSFDPATVTENYNEGINWHSRPSSLNGYYRFYPSEAARSDYGLAMVEVLGEVDGSETVIAQGKSMLPLAMTYTAFNVPLNYKIFGVKATKIKVMFSSSGSPGDIAHETLSVATVSNPVTSTSIGSRLWIDNVTLSY